MIAITNIIFWIVLSVTFLFVLILAFSKNWAFDIFGTRYYLLPVQKDRIARMFRIIGFVVAPLAIATVVFPVDESNFWDFLFYGFVLFTFTIDFGFIYQFHLVKISTLRIHFDKREVKILEVEKIEIWDNVIVFHTESGTELDLGIHAYPKKYQQETVKKLFEELESIAKTYRIELINNSDWSELTNLMMK